MKYVDPDGREDAFFDYFYDMCEMSYGTEGADYVMQNDTSVQVVTIIDAAAKGNSKAQQILAESAKEGAKQIAADGLEVTADAAGILSNVTGDLAITAVVVQPEVAGGLGTASEVSSAVEIGARGAKYAITKDSKDKTKLTNSAIKNGGSFIVGKIVGKFSKKISDDVSIAVSGIASKVYENGIDEAIKNNSSEEHK